jgi:hypothetical protein
MVARGKSDYPPLLAPGSHQLDLLEIHRLAVDAFAPPARQRREALFLQLEEFVQSLLRARIAGDLLVDGSFLTKKPEPGDLDVLLIIDLDFSDSLTPPQEDLIMEINTTRVAPDIDSLTIVRYPRHHEHFGTPLDGARSSCDYGLENSEEWLKGYAIIRLHETNVGRRIRN